MASIGLAASDPMGLWEFASHIRAITVIGTTVRLVAPTVPTERGALDPMALRSFAGHIDPTTEGAASQRASRYRVIGWLSTAAMTTGVATKFVTWRAS
jgi:hypothetical protein